MALTRQSPGIDETPADGAVALSADGAARLIVPGGDFLLRAQFDREGPDLRLSGGDGPDVLVLDFFASATPPVLETAGGARIDPALAELLAGPAAPLQYAQAGSASGLGTAIGTVDSVAGSVTATHTNGARDSLAAGSPIYQGDVLETGDDASIGIVFVDKTTFSLGAEARMVIDALIYNPGESGNRSAFSLVQGAFVFVSGQIAKENSDDMTVTTPVATIGIRGTKVALDVAAEGETTTISLLQEEDGSVGAILVGNDGGSQLLNQANQTTQITSALLAPSIPIILTPAQIQGLFGETLRVLPSGDRTQNGDDDQRGDGETQQEGEDTQQGDAGDTDSAELDDVAAQLAALSPAAGGGADADLNAALPSFQQGATAAEIAATFGGALPNFGSTVGVDSAAIDALASAQRRFEASFQSTPGLIVIEGGPLDDTLIGGDFREAIFGNAGNDSLFGFDNDDELFGGLGDDLIGPGAGDDLVFGGEGNDVVLAGTDYGPIPPVPLVFDPSFGQGNDTLLGGLGQDTVVYAGDPFGVDVDLTAEIATGNPITVGNDTVSAFEHVVGGDGDDTIKGNILDNQLSGGPGDDRFIATQGNDILDGGDGLDIVDLSAGASGALVDLVLGQVASDTFGSDLIPNVEGAIGTNQADLFQTSAAANLIDGRGGDDTLIGSAGNDTLAGGDGTDILSYATEAAGVLVDLAGGVAVGASIGTDQISGIENVLATDLADRVGGNASANLLQTGDGADTLVGSAGDDTLDGGLGVDLVSYAGLGAGVSVDLTTDSATGGAIGSDQILNIEGAVGTDFNDNILGDGGANVLVAGGGSDALDAAGGDDSVLIGADQIDASDTLRGGAGDDTLILTDGGTASVAAFANSSDGSFATLILGSDASYDVALPDAFIPAAAGPGAGATLTINASALTSADSTARIDLSAETPASDGNIAFTGGAGDDSILLATNTIDAGDTLSGGLGTDSLVLVGGGTVDMTVAGFVSDGSFESIVLNDSADYDLTLSDDFIAPGVTLVVDARAIVLGTNALSVDVSDDTDGALIFLGGSSGDAGFGGDGDDLLIGADGNDQLGGALGNDTISGGIGNDTLAGDAGDDLLSGDAGDDSLAGGIGQDSLFGGDGNDTLLAGAGDDSLDGGDGDDVLSIGADDLDALDTLIGGLGDNTLALTGGGTVDAADLANVEAGAFGTVRFDSDDTFTLTTSDALIGAGGTLVIDASALAGGVNTLSVDLSAELDGNASVIGGAGADSFIGGAGDDTFNGGAGIDVADYSGIAGPLTVTGLATVTAAGIGTDTLIAVENLIATGGDDTISGDGAGNTIDGAAGSDSIDGAGGDDSLIGGTGDDTLIAGSGADTLSGDADDDLLRIGADDLQADDALSGGAGSNTLELTAGGTIEAGELAQTQDGSFVSLLLSADAAYDLTLVDAFIGTGNTLNVDASALASGANALLFDASTESDANLSIAAGAGADRITLGTGSDSVLGGAGGDQISIGADALSAADTLGGGGGTDTLVLRDGGTVSAADLTNSSAGDFEAVLLADDAAFTITATDGFVAAGGTLNVDATALAGGANGLAFDASADTDGRVSIDGGAGDDALTGGAGNDTLLGGAGGDSLIGNDGSDRIEIGTGADSVDGGGASDFVIAAAAELTGADTISGGAGADSLMLTGGGTVSAADFANTVDFANLFLGDDNSYDLTLTDAFVATAANVFIDATALSAASSASIDASADSDGTVFVNGGGGADSLTGGAGADTLNGAAGADTLSGGGGNDSLSGADGDDVLIAGAGSDSLDGGANNDQLSIAGDDLSAADTLSGGTGNDILLLTGGGDISAADLANTSDGSFAALDFASNADYSLTFTDGFIVAGTALTVTASGLTSGGNEIVVDASADSDGRLDLTGGAGADTVTGTARADTLTGGGGGDSLIGGAGDDVLTGEAGNDALVAGSGSDSLDGGANADSIQIAIGELTTADTLIGGTGSDTLALSGGGTLSAANLAGALDTSFEAIVLTSDAATTLTLPDAIVAAGNTLAIDASALGAGSAATIDVSAETDGSVDVTGGDGADLLTDGGANVTLAGGAGNDTLFGGSGSDELRGGANDDLIQIAADDVDSGDVLAGDAGTDTLELTGGGTVTAADLGRADGSFETYDLSSDADYTITLNEANIATSGSLNVDASALTSASSTLILDASADSDGTLSVTGGAGDDAITASGGDNSIAAGTGNDTIAIAGNSLSAGDTLSGGTGTDTLSLTGGGTVTAAEFANASDGSFASLILASDADYDVALSEGLVAAGGLTVDATALGASSDAVIDGSANTTGAIVATGGAGDDRFVSGGADDTLDGGDGFDLADYSAFADGVNVSGLTSATGASVGTDSLSNIEGAIGTSGDDTLEGDSGANRLEGGGGADSLIGADGDDTLLGGDGNDTIEAGGSTIDVRGGNDADVIRIDIADLDGTDTVQGGAGSDTLELAGGGTVTAADLAQVDDSFEAFGLADDTAYTITLNDANIASGGTFTIDGSGLTGAALTLDASADTDGTLDATGGAGNDDITAGGGANTIDTGAGNDTIQIAADSLTAADTLTGGSGSDTLQLTAGGTVTAAELANASDGSFSDLLLSAVLSYDITLTDGFVAASGLTVDASVLASASSLTFDASADTDGSLSLTGGAGDDVITGSGNTNDIDAADGNDRIVIAGDALDAADTLDGGAGSDTLDLSGGGTVTSAELANASDFEALDLSSDASYAVTLSNAFIQNTGLTVDASALTAASSTLTLDASAGTDGAVTVTGGAGNDTVTGSTLSDNIDGGAGDDSLIGGSGGDTLQAGSGSDDIDGGANNDMVRIAASEVDAGDVLSGGAGADTLDLTGGGTVSAAALGGVDDSFAVVLLSSDAGYDLTLTDTIVSTGAGTTLSIDASALTAGNALILDASADTDGGIELTGGAGDDVIIGGTNANDLDTGAGNDRITLVSGNLSTNDTLTGGDGSDTLELTGGGVVAGAAFANTDGTFETLLLSTDAITNITLNNAVVGTGGLAVDATALTSAASSLLLVGTADTDGRVNVNAGAGADTLLGGDGGDSLSGAANNDSLVGADGNDTLDAGSGDDDLAGGNDNDLLRFAVAELDAGDTASGGGGNDTLELTGGGTVGAADLGGLDASFETFLLSSDAAYSLTLNETVVGDAATLEIDASALTAGSALTLDASADADGTVSLIGGAGDDLITAGGNANDLDAGDGADRIAIAAGALTAEDTLSGGAGDDTLDLNAGETVSAGELANVDGSFETLLLSADASYDLTLNDAIVSAGGLTIDASALGAAAGLSLNAVADTDGTVNVLGGAGADSLIGGAGNDTLDGADGNDTLKGGAGNDTILTGTGDDEVDGGSANDLVRIAGGDLDANDTLAGADGDDTLEITSGETVTAAELANVNGSFETLLLSADASYDITLTDTAVASGGLTVDGTALTSGGSALSLDASADTDGAVTVLGGAGNDVFTGGAGADSLDGAAGDDSLLGGANADTLNAGSGDDTLAGGGGADILRIDAGQLDGNDTLSGGGEADTLELGGGGTVSAGDLSGIDDSFETLSLTADASYDVSLGDGLVGTGNSLTVDAGALTAGASNLSLDGSGETDGTLVVNSGAGADTLFGGAGADTLSGGGGNDLLRGGGGIDSLTGGAGADTFRFIALGDVETEATDTATALTGDLIVDFASGGDAIEFDGAVFAIDGGAQTLTDGVNFSTIGAAYDGTNGTSSEWLNGDASFIYDGSRLYYDDDPNTEGYVVVAQFNGPPTVAASDISVT